MIELKQDTQTDRQTQCITTPNLGMVICKSRKQKTIKCSYQDVPCNLASAWLNPNSVDSISAATSFAPQSKTFPPRTPLTTARHCSSRGISSTSASRADNSLSACSFSCCFCYSHTLQHNYKLAAFLLFRQDVHAITPSAYETNASCQYRDTPTWQILTDINFLDNNVWRL